MLYTRAAFPVSKSPFSNLSEQVSSQEVENIFKDIVCELCYDTNLTMERKFSCLNF